MNKEQKYTIQGLEEYIRQGEPQQRERGEAWKVAIGLQQVDGLTTSEYLLDTARKHIEGDITSSKTTNIDYQCVSIRCCSHVAKTEISIQKQHVTKSMQRYSFSPK